MSFTVPQYPGKLFHAKLVANANAVAGATGTMLVQFAADNSGGTLQPGAYADVKFPLPAPEVLEGCVPDFALCARARPKAKLSNGPRCFTTNPCSCSAAVSGQ